MLASGSDARPEETGKPSLAGLTKGTPEYKVAKRAYDRWRYANNAYVRAQVRARASKDPARRREMQRDSARRRRADPVFRASELARERERRRTRYNDDLNYRTKIRTKHNGRQSDCKALLVQFMGGACYRCGWSGHPVGFDFHHTDNKTIEFSAGNLSYKRMTSLDFLEELATTELLCALCHRLHHAKERDANT